MRRNIDKVAVFGLGFVGLPLALSFSMKGLQVIGVDIDEGLVRELAQGITHHLEEYKGQRIQEILQEQLEAGTFQVTSQGEYALENCNSIVVTVGIPIENGYPSLELLLNLSRTIGRGLKKGDLVLIRSTVIPGTVRECILPILEGESGLKAGKDFYLGYASERIAEGRAFEEFENMPTLVSGIDQASVLAAKDLLQRVSKAEVLTASSLEVVEVTKVIENVSRDINIAMVNEFARLTKELGIDIFEVIQLANSHKRVNLLQPGPGVGGYCIPNAYHYLEPKALELGVKLDLAAAARRVNRNTPKRVAQLILKKLPERPQTAKVCIFGMAMKDFSNDYRLSPALEVIGILKDRGVEVAVFDPAITASFPFLVENIEEALYGAHGIVVLAKQKGIPFNELAKLKSYLIEPSPFIIDTRNVYTREEVEGAGFIFEGL